MGEVNLRAVDDTGALVTGYSQPLSIAAVDTTLSSPITTSGWENGVWIGSITPTAFSASATLAVDDNAGVTGTSTPSSLVTGPFAALAWNSVASPQAANVPFTVTLRAKDAAGNELPFYSSAVTLSALVPQPLAQIGTLSSTQSPFPFAGNNGLTGRQQVLYTPDQLGGTRRLTGLSLNVASSISAARTYQQWSIRLKHSSRTGLADGLFDNSGWTTVLASSAVIQSAGWLTFSFSTPFDYDGTSSLLVDFSFRNTSIVTTCNVYASPNLARAIVSYTSSSGADPFAFASGSVSNAHPVTRFTGQQTVPMRPASVTLINGVWTGPVSIATSGGGVQLRAVPDASSVIGDSNAFVVAPATPPPVIAPFSEDFEASALSPAWTLTGTNNQRSQIRSDQGARSGTRCLVLDSSGSGGFSRNEATFSCALAGRGGVTLSFWAKSLNEGAHAPSTNPFNTGADFDGVAVSPDGITWYEAQALRSPALTSTWQQFTVALDPVVAGRGWSYNDAFLIRFNRYGDAAAPSDGIAIDDIAITTNAIVVPTLALPASVSESAAPFSASLGISASRETDLVFSLASSSPAKLVVPASVLLPAGQTSVTFPVTLIDDPLLDGPHVVTVSATPPAGSGIASGASSLRVEDDDIPSLGLSLASASVPENGATTATLTLGAPAAVPVTVAFASSDATAATVPASLVLNAGQTKTTFTVTPVNDTKIDGAQTTILTATLGGANASAILTVTDNENTNLTFSSLSTPTEGVGGTGYVNISGTLPAPLVVSLASSNPAQLYVPASVTIPPGATSASFSLTAVDDSETDGPAVVTITASAEGFVSVSGNTTAYDDDLHHFAFEVIPAQVANRSFSATLLALTIDNRPARQSSSRRVYLNAGTASVSLPLTPVATYVYRSTSSVSLANLLIGAVASGVTLRADDLSGHSGVSNAFDVGVGPLESFSVSGLASPQVADAPAPVVITARDAYGNTIPSFSDTVNLTAGPAFTTTGAGTNTSANPAYGYNYTQQRTQVIYPSSDIGPAGRLVSLALNFVSVPGSPLQNWTIRVKHTSGFANTAWDSSGWTVVHQSNANFAENTPGWIEFPFSTPFDYDGVSPLLVDFSYNNTATTGSTQGIVRAEGSSLISYSTLYGFAIGGTDPLTWEGTPPSPSSHWDRPTLRFARATPVAIAPTTTAAFTAGAWSGNVTFNTPSASPVTLQASRDGFAGQGNPFTISSASRVSVAPSDVFSVSDDYRAIFTSWSREYTITNTGAVAASWTATPPATWLSVLPASGSLEPGASAIVTVRLTAAASTLASGTYAADLPFTVDGSVALARRVELLVRPSGELLVTPVSGFSASGAVGGPLSPASFTWTLSNPGDASINWTIATSAPWLVFSSASGSLDAQTSTTVTVTFASDANAQGVGAHSETLVFTNTVNGRGNINLPATLTLRGGIPPQIVAQPAGTTTSYLNNAALTVTTTGDEPIAYQWYRGTSGDISAPVVGATGPTLVTLPLATNHRYWVRARSFAGSADSNDAEIVILPEPLNLVAVGLNAYGEFGDGTANHCSIPGHVASDVVQVASGSGHLALIQADGSLWTVGANDEGQLGDGSTTHRSTPVHVASSVVQIVCGETFTLFRKTDGTLWGTGSSAYGQLGLRPGRFTAPVQLATNVAHAAAGTDFILFITNDGQLWGMGRNSEGQLGDGSTNDRSSPVLIATGVAHAAAGRAHGVFVSAQGVVWNMGSNFNRQFGTTAPTSSAATTPVAGASDVLRAYARHDHGFHLKRDGSAWAMGTNASGQLGTGSSNYPPIAVQVATNVAQITCGKNHTLFVKNDGAVLAAGVNTFGQFANGSSSETPALSPILVATGVASASASDTGSFLLGRKPSFPVSPVSTAVLPGGTATLSSPATGPGPLAYQWYAGASGNTANPVSGATMPTFTTPALSTAATYWVRAANTHGSADGPSHQVVVCTPPLLISQPVDQSLAVRGHAAFNVTAQGGALSYQWYEGNAGDTSHPVVGATGATFITPYLTTGRAYWAQITNLAGSVNSRTTNATISGSGGYKLLAAGLNASGQLGDGTTADRASPYLLANNVVQVSTGYIHSLFLRSDHTLWALGDNTDGRLGDGTTTSRSTAVQIAADVVQIAAGSGHSAFLKADGSLWTTGRNSYGQLGTGDTIGRLGPVQVATEVSSVAASGERTRFVKKDGSLWSFGRIYTRDNLNVNAYSLLPVPIASGVAMLCPEADFFVKLDGTLWGMGDNYYGQIGNGFQIEVQPCPVKVADNVRGVTASFINTLILKLNGDLFVTGVNWYGQFGNPASNNLYTSPTLLHTGIQNAAAGYEHNFFLKATGDLQAAGSNSSGQFGTGSVFSTNQPIASTIAPGVVAVSSTYRHTLYLQTSSPYITASAASVFITAGRSVALTVQAGPTDISYQWYRGASGDTSVPLAGATSASYTTPSLYASASYWVRVANSLGSASSLAALVTVWPDSDMDGLPDTWESAQGLEPASATGDNGALGDPDGDGLANLLEYATGLSPRARNNSPLSVSVGLHPTTGARHLVVAYRRLTTPGTFAAVLTTSDNLSAWAPLDYVPDQLSVIPDADGLAETVTVRLNPALGSGRRFIRLEVSAR